MASISRDPDAMILDNILLDEGLASPFSKPVLNCLNVHVCLRKVTIVPWNMVGRLCSANAKMMITIDLTSTHAKQSFQHLQTSELAMGYDRKYQMISCFQNRSSFSLRSTPGD